jgi:alpha,alpha-trehalase
MKFPLQIHELGELFERVQLESIFPDGKTFPDCIPKGKLEDILSDYKQQKTLPDFSLSDFVSRNFEQPVVAGTGYQTDTSKPTAHHIQQLWDYLTRQPSREISSIIPLPKPYVVPGGRFREIYYWDSYFTMLGLVESNRLDLASNMVENFAHLIDTVGYIPNGNRTYFIGRSQPPFFSVMVKLLAKRQPDALTQYLNHLEKEYSFWMRGRDSLRENEAAYRAVKLSDLSDGTVLNRYWDENDTPRPESYKEDVELSHQSKQKPSELYRNLRAAAESGWDFSSRWFQEGGDFSTTHTTEIIPVDLNCLILHLEQTLAEAHQQIGNKSKSSEFELLALERKAAIQKYCWSDTFNFYFDYDFKTGKQKTPWTLAGFFPMFFKVAEKDQATHMAEHLKSKFLKTGGLTTTLVNSGQQWDAPNGWAPLQWICYQGLLNYGYADELANDVKKRWLTSNEAVFNMTGKMTEKYDVWNENADASGGEYPNQDGFGWTNGVYLAMISHR